MPLSEDEERILSEIESQLRETDPQLAHQVSSTTVYTDAFVVALGASVLLLSVSYVLAFVGFLGMFAAALFIERSLRRIGRTGLREASQAMRSSSLRAYFDNAGSKARERLHRDEDE